MDRVVPANKKEYLKEMADINSKYDNAISLMEKYLRERNPWFKVGKERYKRVVALLELNLGTKMPLPRIL